MSYERTDIDRVAAPSEGLVPREAAGYYAGNYSEAYVEELEAENDGPRWTAVLGAVWRAAKKRKWLIIVTTVMVTFVVAAEVSRYRPSYSASVLLEIRKDSNTPVLSAVGDADAENIVNINTKMLMIESRPLLEDVVRKLELTQEERFLDIADKRSWGQMADSLLRRVGLSHRSALDDRTNQTLSSRTGTQRGAQSNASSDPGQSERLPDIPKSDPTLDRYVAIIQGGLDVSHPRDTQALKITFSHTYPAIAAEVANGVAQSFIQRNFEKKTESFNTTSTWLEKSTADLKAKMTQSEQALADYMRDHKILPNQSQSLAADMLIRLHDQLARAETDLLLKQSLYDEVMRGRGDRLPQAFSDPKIADLQKRINELAVADTQLALSYGPDNPKIQEVRQTKAVLKQQLAASSVALQEKVKVDYERAVRDKSAISAALDRAQAEASQQDQSSVQYNILKDEAATASQVYKDFLQKTKQASLEVAKQHNNISVIQPALIPKHPNGPTYGVAVLLALLGSLAGTVGIAFLVEQLDKTIKDVGDVNRYLRLPTLGVIPSIRLDKQLLAEASNKKRNSQLSVAGNGSRSVQEKDEGSQPKGLLTAGSWSAPFEVNGAEFITPDGRQLAAEAYRALRTSVLLSTEGSPKTLLFTSGRPGEGKTTTVLNTAICFAQLSGSVLIIDSDLRKPYGKSALSGGGATGLSSFLCGTIGIDQAIYKLQIPNVSLLPRGPACPNPAELISSNKMTELLRTLAGHYDHILIDSPPLLCATDSVILATLVDGVILVVRGGKSTRDAVHQSRLMLTGVGAKVVGIVLNDIDFRRVHNLDFRYYPYPYEDKDREVEGASDILLR